MIPLNLLEHQNAVKALYSRCVGPVCQKHDITRMEMDILLFLYNNPRYDTASDIVELRYLAKSQVSASVGSLERRGYLEKRYAEGNRKTVHLSICSEASDIVSDGRRAQEEFLKVMVRGIPESDLDCMKRCMQSMMQNIDAYLREERNV